MFWLKDPRVHTISVGAARPEDLELHLKAIGLLEMADEYVFRIEEKLLNEAYKILGLKKGGSKEEVIKAANGLQKKIHPDVNPNSNTERLSQIVNEAKEAALKDFS